MEQNDFLTKTEVLVDWKC